MAIGSRHGINTRPWATVNNGRWVAWRCCSESPLQDASFTKIHVVLLIESCSIVGETSNRVREEG